MKKIEKGCMAIIIGGGGQLPGPPKNIGKIVTVGNFIGRMGGTIDDFWEVDQPMRFSDGSDLPFNREKYMERIDDEDSSQKIKESKKITEKA